MIQDRHAKRFHFHIILLLQMLENSDLRAKDEPLRGAMKTRGQEGRPVNPGNLWHTRVALGPLTHTGPENAGIT